MTSFDNCDKIVEFIILEKAKACYGKMSNNRKELSIAELSLIAAGILYGLEHKEIENEIAEAINQLKK